ncbi:MAG: SurA N-terminal domain-containing protein [Syntrophaceae bacterium]|nr:SurA N-terminal domain-containing protein [Syntrophaceae bacterium]
MLRILREHATSWMLKGILLLVAVTFISWGGYSLIREKKETYAARVNGVVIEMRDFGESYQNVMKQYRDALGPSFSEKMAEELRLKEKVLNDLISRVLILQEAARLGFDISNEELRESIESVPSFQVNGQFDRRLYERFLRINRMSAEQFERTQREGLLFLKVTDLIRLNAGRVSEEELLETYLFENERINLHFLKIAPESFGAQVTLNEMEIKEYFQKHPEEFRIPTFVQIQYLLFRPSDFEGKVQVSSEEIKRYYDLHKDRFRIPKKVRAREILIHVSPEDPPNRVEEKRKKAEEILEKLKKTKDFVSLAKQYSESKTASRGGEMGWIQRGTLEESVERALFSMKAGEVSGVTIGRNGFYIFKVDEVVEEKGRSLEEVRDQILQTLKKEKAKSEASRKAEDAFYSLFRSRDLEGYAREKGVPIKTTALFKEGDYIPEIGKDPAFYSSAFSLKVGEISPVVNIPPNLYILKLIDRKESRIPPLEEVREEVRKKVLGMKCEEKARQVAEDLLNQIRSGRNMNEVAREKGFPLQETGFFTRTGGLVPKIGLVGDSIALLSSLTEKTPLPKEVLRIKDTYFVVRLAALEPADLGQFPSIKKNLQKRLLLQKQEESFQYWLEQLRAKAKIEINKDLL